MATQPQISIDASGSLEGVLPIEAESGQCPAEIGEERWKSDVDKKILVERKRPAASFSIGNTVRVVNTDSKGKHMTVVCTVQDKRYNEQADEWQYQLKDKGKGGLYKQGQWISEDDIA